MARKARVEIEGGLYHVITRGNDRQEIAFTKTKSSQHELYDATERVMETYDKRMS